MSGEFEDAAFDADDSVKGLKDAHRKGIKEGYNRGRNEGFGCGCLVGIVLTFAAISMGWCSP